MKGISLMGWDSTNSKWVKVVCDANGKLKIDPALILENPPTENEAKKAATSEWCFDHKANASDHHAKYTDLEAQTACNLNGGLHWSCSGNTFQTIRPHIDAVTKYGNGNIRAEQDNLHFYHQVNIPTGATVSGIIVYGNAASESETFELIRYKPVDNTPALMATQNINTEDTTISYPIIDNGLYSYFIMTSSLDTNDEIWGAVITYTL